MRVIRGMVAPTNYSVVLLDASYSNRCSQMCYQNYTLDVITAQLPSQYPNCRYHKHCHSVARPVGPHMPSPSHRYTQLRSINASRCLRRFWGQRSMVSLGDDALCNGTCNGMVCTSEFIACRIPDNGKHKM